jgi:uroporphyrinogen-III synthase
LRAAARRRAALQAAEILVFELPPRERSLHKNIHVEPDLGGARVLVTRPAHQAGSLAHRVAAAGGVPVLLPAIEIAEPSDPTRLEQALAAVAHASYAIFVSRNAVERGMSRLRVHGWPPTLRFAAVGAATARALAAEGIRDVLAPADRFDSEALLALLPPAAVHGRTIVLFRGEGGRELLAETLVARGAHLEHAVCYRRVRPARPEPAALAQLARGEIDVVVTTSVEALENLVALAGPTACERLLATALVVVSERGRAASRALGFSGAVQVATRADDESVLAALGAWRDGQKNL